MRAFPFVGTALCAALVLCAGATSAVAQVPTLPGDPELPGGPPTLPTDPRGPGGPPTLPTDPEGPGGPPTLPTDPRGPGGPPTLPGDPQGPGAPPSLPGDPEGPGAPPSLPGLPQGPGAPPAFPTAPTQPASPGYVLTGAAGWRTLALPKTGLGLGGNGPGGSRFVPGFLQPLYTAGYLGADRDQRNRQGTANVFLYDEATGGFFVPRRATSVHSGDGFWVYVFEDDDPFTRGVQGGFPKTLDASEGTPVTGAFAFALSYTPGAPLPGVNLIGNPYDEAIDWNHPSWTRTNLSETVQVWDPGLDGGTGGYRTWNGLVGDLREGVIPAGQGFHVEALGPGPELVVTEAAKLGVEGPTYGLTGNDPPSAATAFSLRLSGTVGGVERTIEVFVSLSADASAGFDARDARRLAGAPGADALRLYALIPGGYQQEGAALSIVSLPVAPRGAIEIPIHAEALMAGTPSAADARLSWEGTRLNGGGAVALRDTRTGALYDLSVPGQISLRLSSRDALTATGADLLPAQNGAGIPDAPPAPRPLHAAPTGARFRLVLTPEATKEGPSGLFVGEIGPNPSSGRAFAEVTLADAGPISVGVYDALGRQVRHTTGHLEAGTHRLSLPTQALPSATYVLRFVTEGATETRRLTVVR